MCACRRLGCWHWSSWLKKTVGLDGLPLVDYNAPTETAGAAYFVDTNGVTAPGRDAAEAALGAGQEFHREEKAPRAENIDVTTSRSRS